MGAGLTRRGLIAGAVAAPIAARAAASEALTFQGVPVMNMRAIDTMAPYSIPCFVNEVGAAIRGADFQKFARQRDARWRAVFEES